MNPLEKMRDLNARRAELFAEFERSMAIQGLWPEAFAAGRCTAVWHSSYGKVPRLVITRTDGAWRQFSDQFVPACIPRPRFARGHDGRPVRHGGHP